MYESLGHIQLKTGERVEMGLVRGPDLGWAERVEKLLGHKGEIWNWQNAGVLRQETGVEARFYLLHRQGQPFANIATFTHRGVGHFGHVWTNPEDRRQGAASQLMGAQMAHFRQEGGRALFLGTGFDSAPYHIYRSHGFVGLEEKSGNMEYYAGEKAQFEAEYFARGPVEIQDVSWIHWPSSAALFLGDFPGAVRCAPLRLFSRASTEGPFLPLVRGEEQRGEKGEKPRARVLFQTTSQAVVGLSIWDWDPLWPATCLVDVYCHPDFWEEGRALLADLALPQAERYVAYSDPGCLEKGEVLRAAGFRPAGRHPRRVALDRARTRLADVSVWERG